MAFGEEQHILCGERRRPHQRVESSHCLVTLHVATDVECRSRTRSHGNPVDAHYLILGHTLVAGDDAAGGLVLDQINSIGMSSSIHDAPWSADAATPATTPCRPDRNQAAAIRSRSAISCCFGAYTSRKIRRCQRFSSYSVSCPVASASEPRNTRAMAGWLHRWPTSARGCSYGGRHSHFSAITTGSRQAGGLAEEGGQPLQQAGKGLGCGFAHRGRCGVRKRCALGVDLDDRNAVGQRKFR